MNNFIKKLVFLFLIIFSINASAQIEIKSTILDTIAKYPVVGANVYIQNTTIGSISNIDGNFVLLVPQKHKNDTLVISSIGYKSFKAIVNEFDNSKNVYLEEDVASLDEVVIVASTRPKTGNDIVLRALDKLEVNLPEEPYLQKGFLRHKEKNKKQYKWLIESAITLYDSSYASGANKNLKINVDEVRKSYDLRDIDSLFSFYTYLKYYENMKNLKSTQLVRNRIKTSSLIKAIRWNDNRINGLTNLFKGPLNLVRNSNMKYALFGENVLNNHQFHLDTILVDNGRKLYKIKISEGKEYVGLNTKNIYNEGYHPQGWMYIYWDNFAIKKIEYELVPASKAQKSRSKSLFNSNINHKLILTFTEFNEKMYPKYIYYETPKLVSIGDRSSDKLRTEETQVKDEEEQFYVAIQEILFTEIIQDQEIIQEELNKEWSDDIFSPRPYNKDFWKNYNVLLESKEEDKLIEDLSKRASLFKQ